MLYMVKGHNGEARVFTSAEEANQEARQTAGGTYLALDVSVEAVKAVVPEKKGKKAARDLEAEIAALQKENEALKSRKGK